MSLSKTQMSSTQKDQSVDGESFSVSKTAKIDSCGGGCGFACRRGDLGDSWIFGDEAEEECCRQRCLWYSVGSSVSQSIQDGWCLREKGTQGAALRVFDSKSS